MENPAAYTRPLYSDVASGNNGQENRNGTVAKSGDRPDVLTPEALVRHKDKKAPRIGHSANTSFVELGLCLITTSRKERNVHLLPWGDLKATLEPVETPQAKQDPLARARFYQSLLDNGIVENRAALARYLGVSRSRVTQVLRRLTQRNSGESS